MRPATYFRLTSPTAKNRPSLLMERQVAAFILSRLVQVFEVGESLQSICAEYGVDDEKPPTVSLSEATVRFRESLAVFLGVEGVAEGSIMEIEGIAVGRARKKRCEGSKFSSSWTTTAEAPAT